MFTSVYERAGIRDPELVAAHETCRRVLRRSDTMDFMVLRLVPPALRPAFWALCACGRVVDDLADTGSDGPDGRAARVDAWTTAFDRELRLGTSKDPVRRAIIHTVLTWDLSGADLLAMAAELRQDARGRTFATWQEWSGYSRTVNGSSIVQLALLMTRAGLSPMLRARQLEALGRRVEALFLIDNLFDLSEDITHRCVNLPSESLERFGVTSQDLSARRWTPAMEALTGHLAARARAGLDDQEWARELPPALALPVHGLSGVYRVKLRAFERAGKTVLRRRPRVSRLARHRVLAPARVRAAGLWALFPPVVPGSLDGPSAAPAREPGPPPGPRASVLPPPEPPPPHPSGARPPSPPAGRLPPHVAIVMDGNGRWATKQGLPRTDGHRAGAEALRDVVYGALEIGLPRLTVYAFSTENWKRPAEELDSLMDALRDSLADPGLRRHDVRVRWLGSSAGLPRELVDALAEAEYETRSRTGLILTLCVNYGGRAEITEAAGALAREAAAGRLDPAHVSEHLFARHLSHPELPDVDLLWRTGGESRTSNFLPWQAVYAELRFTDGHWPDMDRRDLWPSPTTRAVNDATEPSRCPATGTPHRAGTGRAGPS